MKIITTTVYNFSELSNAAKQVARDWWRTSGLDYEWWDSTFEDAKEAGLQITSFDLDRNRHAKGEFIRSAVDCAERIIENHGNGCKTFKTATAFLKERETFTCRLDHSGDEVSIEDCEADFLKSILEDYSILLQSEVEHLLSDESVDETIIANEYTFTADGKRAG